MKTQNTLSFTFAPNKEHSSWSLICFNLNFCIFYKKKQSAQAQILTTWCWWLHRHKWHNHFFIKPYKHIRDMLYIVWVTVCVRSQYYSFCLTVNITYVRRVTSGEFTFYLFYIYIHTYIISEITFNTKTDATIRPLSFTNIRKEDYILSWVHKHWESDACCDYAPSLMASLDWFFGRASLQNRSFMSHHCLRRAVYLERWHQ